MYLMHVCHIEQCKGVQVNCGGTGFFERLARCAFGRGLAVFHEAGRQGPVTVARLDGALAQQNLLAIDGDAADHHLRVFVMNAAAGRADCAQMRVTGRHDALNARAAIAAMMQRRAVNVEGRAGGAGDGGARGYLGGNSHSSGAMSVRE